MKNLHAKQVMSYVLLPGIIPRAKALFASGFGMLAFFMASIYGTVRLLPPNHPYLNPANIGRFGIRHVIAEAANRLVISRNNIDQIVIFTALMAGAVILFMQFALLGYSFLVPSAQAAGLFSTPSPRNDIAFLLLDHVFGVPKFFCSNGMCSKIQGTLPVPFHDALHALLQFYSIGLLCVGVLIFLYFVTVVVVETATSGSPFGQRFDDIWVPIRLVVALALLIPVNWGLNSAQYITLFAARAGSGFATNAWLAFNQSILDKNKADLSGANPIGEAGTLIALAQQQDVSGMVQTMSLIHACNYAYAHYDRSGRSYKEGEIDGNSYIKPYFTKNGILTKDKRSALELTKATTYQQALTFFDNSDIIITFGEKDKKYSDPGNVSPMCGQLRLKATPLADASISDGDLTGAQYISKRYFDMIKNMWFTDERFQQFAIRAVSYGKDDPLLCTAGKGCDADHLPACTGGINTNPLSACQIDRPGNDWKQGVIDYYQGIFNNDLITAWRQEAAKAPTRIDTDVLQRGWAGAGIWYNKIAEMNGAFMGAVLDIPDLKKYPLIMEEIQKENRQNNKHIGVNNQFEPSSAGDAAIKVSGQEDAIAIANALNGVYQGWSNTEANQANEDKATTSNIFEDSINMIFGTSGLMDIRKENAHTHPLAQLVAVGKGLVDGTIRNLAISTISATAGGFLGAFRNSQMAMMGASVANAVSGFMLSVSFIGLTAGLVLFYVLPFMPFVYFYFTVGTWIKTIFEAMVGVPLWALAHLRLDGNGLPGSAAQNGYFLILEIFLRPILAVFGLIAGILIFSAQVRILNYTWDLVVNNMTGFDGNPDFGLIGDIRMKRATIDEFFFTIIYTIIVYMLASASFKLIDRIPDNIMRWMGAGVSTFSDLNEDPTEGLNRYVAIGGMTFGQNITDGVTKAAGGVGGTLGQLAAGKPTPPTPPTTPTA